MKKSTPKFEKIDSGIPGIKAFKPNAAMQKQIADSMPEELLKAFPKWKALAENWNKK